MAEEIKIPEETTEERFARFVQENRSVLYVKNKLGGAAGFAYTDYLTDHNLTIEPTDDEKYATVKHKITVQKHGGEIELYGYKTVYKEKVVNCVRGQRVKKNVTELVMAKLTIDEAAEIIAPYRLTVERYLEMWEAERMAELEKLFVSWKAKGCTVEVISESWGAEKAAEYGAYLERMASAVSAEETESASETTAAPDIEIPDNETSEVEVIEAPKINEVTESVETVAAVKAQIFKLVNVVPSISRQALGLVTRAIAEIGTITGYRAQIQAFEKINLADYEDMVAQPIQQRIAELREHLDSSTGYLQGLRKEYDVMVESTRFNVDTLRQLVADYPEVAATIDDAELQTAFAPKISAFPTIDEPASLPAETFKPAVVEEPPKIVEPVEEISKQDAARAKIEKTRNSLKNNNRRLTKTEAKIRGLDNELEFYEAAFKAALADSAIEKYSTTIDELAHIAAEISKRLNEKAKAEITVTTLRRRIENASTRLGKLEAEIATAA